MALASPNAQPPSVAAGLEQLGAGGPVDRAVDAAAAEQGRVRGVHDGVDVLGGDVAERDLEAGAHAAQRRFADRGAAGAKGPHAGLRAGAREVPVPEHAADAKKKPLALGSTTDHSNTTVIPAASFQVARKALQHWQREEHTVSRTRH